VYDHSWGAILALEYYRAHPDRVISIGFGSPVFDLPAFTTYVRGLLPTLSARRSVPSAVAKPAASTIRRPTRTPSWSSSGGT